MRLAVSDETGLGLAASPNNPPQEHWHPHHKDDKETATGGEGGESVPKAALYMDSVRPRALALERGGMEGTNLKCPLPEGVRGGAGTGGEMGEGRALT